VTDAPGTISRWTLMLVSIWYGRLMSAAGFLARLDAEGRRQRREVDLAAGRQVRAAQRPLRDVVLVHVVPGQRRGAGRSSDRTPPRIRCCRRGRICRCRTSRRSCRSLARPTRTRTAAPRRYQSGRSGRASKCRPGTKRPAATSRASIELLKCSKRTPGLIVKRPTVQESCT